MEVVRVAGDLQLPEHHGRRWVAEVDDEEGVDLLECDEVAAVTHEAGRVDLLPGCESLEPSDRLHGLVEDVDSAARTAPAPRDVAPCSGYPEVAAVLVHAELVEDPAGHLAFSEVCDLPVLEPDLVYGRVRVPPGRDVHVVEGDVDGAAGSEEQGLRGDRLQRILGVEAQHRSVAVPRVGAVDVVDLLCLDYPCLALVLYYG